MKVNIFANFYENKKNSPIKLCMDLSIIRKELIIYYEEDRNYEDLDKLLGIVDGNIMNSKYDGSICMITFKIYEKRISDWTLLESSILKEFKDTLKRPTLIINKLKRSSRAIVKKLRRNSMKIYWWHVRNS